MTVSRILQSTSFEKIYALLAVEDDKSLIFRMSLVFLVYEITVAISSFRKPATYGKHSKSGGLSFHPRIAWALMEGPAWIVPMVLLYQCAWEESYLRHIPNLSLILAFMFHYIHRSLIYPVGISTQAKPVPLEVCIGAFLFCSFNGLFQGVSLLNVHFVNGISWQYSLGLVLFLTGMTINITHDWKLLLLKKKSLGPEKKSNYAIPRGMLFDFISGANYAGEILEWWGLAIAAGGIPQFQFAALSTLFLGSRAVHHHTFYKATFGKLYPTSRKAIIPFVL